MKKKHYLLLTAFVAVVAIAIVSTKRFWLSDEPSNRETVNLAVLLPTTGPLANYSQEIIRGIELGVDSLDSKATDIRLTIDDSRADAKTALAALKRIASRPGKKIVIGDLTSASTLALIPELESSQMFLVSPTASDPGVARGSEYSFSIYATSDAEAHFMGQAAKDKGGAIGVIHSMGATAEAMARSAATALKAGNEGGTGIFIEAIPTQSSQFGDFVQKLPKADAIVVAAFPDEIISLLKVATERRFIATWILPSTMYSNEAIAALPKNGQIYFVVAPKFRSDDSSAKARRLNDAYKLKFDQEPSVWTALGYDATLTADLIIKSGFSPNSKLPSFEGATGNTVFDEYGQATKEFSLIEVVDGSLPK